MQGFINKTKRPIVNRSEIMKLFSYYFAKSKIAQKQAKINFEIILQKYYGWYTFVMLYLVLEDQKLVVCHN